MNLQDFVPKITVKQVEALYKNQFSKPLKIGGLSLTESKKLLTKTQGIIAEFKRSGKKARYAEKNPTYLRLKMVEEAVSIRIANLAESFTKQLNAGSRTMTPNYVKALKAVAGGAKLKESTIRKLKVSRGLRRILESRKNSIAFMRKIVENKKVGKMALNEGEISTAQTTLAAQDIADQIQSMIEKFADIRYKELPSLNDSIRNSQGVEQAQQFNDAVLGSLEALTGSLESARGEINNAVATLTGEEVAMGDGDLDVGALGGDEMGGEMGGMEPGMDDMGGDEFSNDLGDEFDMDFEPDEDPEIVDLGRERR